MLQAFVDESYCHDWFYMVAAVAWDEPQAEKLAAALTEVIRTECARLWVQEPREIHGYELFSGEGTWSDVGLHDRLAVAGRALGAVRDSGVRFIIRGIDRAAQRRRYPTAYDPYPMVLTHVMREVNKYADRVGKPARIVCDEIHQHDRHRAMLERHRLQGTPGFNSTTLGAVVGALEFTSSHASAMIQAADVVAYLAHRIASRPNAGRPERRSRGNLWRIVEPQIEHQYCWAP